MKLKLLKCKICDAWYRPAAHDAHCPVCGTLQWFVLGRWITINPHTGRSVARAIPQDYTVGRLFN